MISLLQQISPETLAEVIKELGQDPRFKDDAEYAILGHYVEIQPRAAIEIALGMPSRFDQNRFIYQNFLNAISELHDVWASKDPVASLQWLQSENSGIPEELHNRMFGNACRSLAYADPQATIAGILGDDHVDDGAIGQDIGRGMNSPDPIKAFFKAADELATDPSLDADRIASIRRGVADGMSILFFDQPFSTVTDLVNECLTADEKIAFVNRCNEQGTIVDSAKWASWLTTFEPSQMDSATAPPHPLVTRMESWAYEDPNGAGAWLDGMPDGPLKDQASAAYNEGLNHRTAGTAP
ncbi:hypothetical protein [Luteolibacter sp. LG18]|uniref:hypothetical protein n=1 Tax=Luteolibacter sp. LG18 TaxID=2819286 RepID=UPI0030C721DE